MKISIRDVVLGGLWGLISGIVVLVIGTFSAMAGVDSFIPSALRDLFVMLMLLLLFLPGYLSLLSILIIYEISDRNILPLLPLFSIFLGIIFVNKAPSIIAKLRAIKEGR